MTPFSVLLLCLPAIAAAQAGPPSPHQPPQPEETGAGRSWAEKYAERKKFWCFQPVKNAQPPPVKDAAWSAHPIDRFILAKLEAAGLQPAPPAAPEVLKRRLSLVLTGLPPAESSQTDLTDLTDRLLASPAFGEHWARHWMDVARYAESFGSEHDYLNPHAWRYRDYLVRAFNTDLPYDRFIHEQLAGDLIKEPRLNSALRLNESLLGAAFLRMTEFYAAPVDTMREQASGIDWQIESVSKAFLGLTLACSRCHDHKFDPLSTADFYALYGVLAGARPVLNIIDDPTVLTAQDAELTQLKEKIRRELTAMWLAKSPGDDALRKAVAGAKKDSPLARLRPPHATDKPSARGNAEMVLPLAQWHHSGPGLPQRVSQAGSLSLHATGDLLVRAIRPAGYFSDEISERHGGSLRSPEFTLTKRNVSVLAGGTGKARLRLVVDGCQADIVLFKPANIDLTDAAPRWQTIRLRDQWLGRRAHLELMTRDDLPTVGTIKDATQWAKSDGRSSFGIAAVTLHEDGVPTPPLETAAATAANVKAALIAMRDGKLADERARLLQALLEAGLLANQAPAGSALGTLIARRREIEARIPVASRAPGVRDDGSSQNTPIFIRGDHLTPGEMVPRRMPEILGARQLDDSQGDRLALARELTRSDNPLTARVMVNRVWHHLFGCGLVATPDNFGRMGARPSHPELLDYLATQFMRDGWSVKKLIRHIVTSRTWQLSSEPPAGATERDPDNQLLSHARVRRLPAESVRDAMLAVAGNLDSAAGGPGVKVFYRTAIDPDKQPPSGPLDGDRRRSLYLEVRRNFPNDFLTVFDAPRPNLPAGARSETNVPAQSIALLNDPFVHHQAAVWARRIAALPATDAERVTQMHHEAFGRAPTTAELERALEFLTQQRGQPVSTGRKTPPDPWHSLAHALFNMKEFIYLR